MAKDLTPKQERFCQEYIKTGNATESYRASYNCSQMKPETVNRNAHDLLKNNKITTRIKNLSEEIKNKAVADAEEIQMMLTRFLRGQATEECIVVESTGDYCSEAKIMEKQVTPKDRIKACETLAKMRGYFDIKINLNTNLPIIEDNI
jgi:phage terminase small subunit